ncbi:hypothetical protein P153DRAFT_356519 [Dothidotthia symphoricarpi CBS 119687]|uniref:Uncharacterized protein n=1 Tax=Dothidotthia symphoricarpi CBS 119687 TaxID=1392245 RepID=A0A6A6AE36_9PLEO|nr:uncharacterized protein P153DRAFT_356519 [Dothidotthia symphoricarpi CBS 119687]KAF2129836.1 hypothetical protein P153DRAFT_356519 [Dothidotthia symphoricarpi CBS 119687]
MCTNLSITYGCDHSYDTRVPCKKRVCWSTDTVRQRSDHDCSNCLEEEKERLRGSRARAVGRAAGLAVRLFLARKAGREEYINNVRIGLQTIYSCGHGDRDYWSTLDPGEDPLYTKELVIRKTFVCEACRNQERISSDGFAAVQTMDSPEQNLELQELKNRIQQLEEERDELLRNPAAVDSEAINQLLDARTAAQHQSEDLQARLEIALVERNSLQTKLDEQATANDIAIIGLEESLHIANRERHDFEQQCADMAEQFELDAAITASLARPEPAETGDHVDQSVPKDEAAATRRLEEIKSQTVTLLVKGRMLMDERKKLQDFVDACKLDTSATEAQVIPESLAADEKSDSGEIDDDRSSWEDSDEAETLSVGSDDAGRVITP